MTGHPHLSDDQLAEVCLHAAPSKVEQRHLERCELCEGRRAALASLLREVSDVARADADAVFTSERLDRQRDRIFGLIEHTEPHGQLISFPSGHEHTPEPSRGHPERRWIAGAAAAGLLLGILGGHFAQNIPDGDTSLFSQAGQASAVAPQQTSTPALSEEEFLSRLELAVDGAGGSTLRPLHEMTPLVWEVAAP
ncbi:MAG: hypothetical protein O2930_10275 [Acidobacteria bacterium]|nr:hypothetical protein [Acidobacteriota bacterium]